MQTQQLNRITETLDATPRSQKPSPFLQLAHARTRQRPIRIALPLRRRESCQNRRAMLAALRDAEFEDWMASGGDYLDSMHQPIL